ncbi:hypothetical protein Q5H91_03665 [Sphingomonas sp. KR1UV-12]|uniref:DUF6894 domain-containing protein n=1 Tax=Sphingomonas aurea TaxID=3063994 RepID=A0ABT9EH55_9SPHN|nr:hypothetical protein [Sphingomonas sp. KR1UV-12]MDP1026298.1 hypothetical protein [Sphingomonas sp. KR1UV-12]
MLCFFNLAGAVYDPDVVGHEVASIDKARVIAAKYLADLIHDRPDVVWAGEEVRVEVTDEDQLVLFTVIAFGVDAISLLLRSARNSSRRQLFQHVPGICAPSSRTSPRPLRRWIQTNGLCSTYTLGGEQETIILRSRDATKPARSRTTFPSTFSRLNIRS